MFEHTHNTKDRCTHLAGGGVLEIVDNLSPDNRMFSVELLVATDRSRLGDR